MVFYNAAHPCLVLFFAYSIGTDYLNEYHCDFIRSGKIVS